MSEKTLYSAHPSMFRNRPVSFLICILLVPVGLGLVILLFWWLKAKGTTLTVTEESVTLRLGLLSKRTSEVFHFDVRNVQVAQGPLQRMLGVGAIAVSSAGQSGFEIEVHGIPQPEKVKALINKYRKEAI